MPEELTPEMYEAAEATSIRVYTGTITYDVSTVYRATLASAPEPPSGWQKGRKQTDTSVLVWADGGYWIRSWPCIYDWWTPLPPPPEVKP